MVHVDGAVGCCSAVASQSGFAVDLISTCKHDPIPVIYRVIMTKNKHIRGLFVQKPPLGNSLVQMSSEVLYSQGTWWQFVPPTTFETLPLRKMH